MAGFRFRSRSSGALGRAALLAMVLLGVSAGSAVAQEPPAKSSRREGHHALKDVPAENFFANYNAYLKLPKGERAHYRMAYYLTVDQRPATRVTLQLKVNQDVRPLRVGETGRVLDLPRPSEMLLDPRVLIRGPDGHRLDVSSRLEPDWDTSPEMAISSLLLALQEAQAGEKKGAGLIGFALPKLDRIYFRGVAQGEVVRGDGRSKPMPKSPQGVPMLIFTENPRAVSVRFPDAPASMDIGSAPVGNAPPQR